ncbi:MAG: hypothetical protein OXC84_12155 [Gammaproteobacteria bacterium]|nr:hypothetical protein [Gammaproteobacteria bacterium]
MLVTPGAVLLHALTSFVARPACQHGISLLHELKCPADFQHFEYANPNAPEGGFDMARHPQITQWVQDCEQLLSL